MRLSIDRPYYPQSRTSSGYYSPIACNPQENTADTRAFRAGCPQARFNATCSIGGRARDVPFYDTACPGTRPRPLSNDMAGPAVSNNPSFSGWASRAGCGGHSSTRRLRPLAMHVSRGRAVRTLHHGLLRGVDAVEDNEACKALVHQTILSSDNRPRGSRARNWAVAYRPRRRGHRASLQRMTVSNTRIRGIERRGRNSRMGEGNFLMGWAPNQSILAVLYGCSVVVESGRVALGGSDGGLRRAVFARRRQWLRQRSLRGVGRRLRS